MVIKNKVLISPLLLLYFVNVILLCKNISGVKYRIEGLPKVRKQVFLARLLLSFFTSVL